MRFILLGDVHARSSNPASRKDDFFRTHYRKLSEVFKKANQEDIPILCTGDLFDRPDPTYLLLTKYVQLFQSLKNKFYVVPGNHDLYGASLATLSRSAVGLFSAAGVVSLLDDNGTTVGSTGTKDIVVFGTSYMHGRKPSPRPGCFNILVNHEMILLDKMWKEQEDYTFAGEYLKNNNGWDLILCGHYHYRFLLTENGRTILNPGAMVRLKASRGDMAMTPGYFIFDTDKPTEPELLLLSCARPADEVFLAKEKIPLSVGSPKLDEFVSELSDNKGGENQRNLSEVMVSFLDASQASDKVKSIVKELIAAAEVELGDGPSST